MAPFLDLFEKSQNPRIFYLGWDYETLANEFPKKSLGNLFIKNARSFSYITKDKVKAAISSFGWNESAGPDNFKPIVLQNLNEESFDSLTHSSTYL